MLSYVAQDVPPTALSLGVPQPDGAVWGAGEEGAGSGAPPPTSYAGSTLLWVHLNMTGLVEVRVRSSNLTQLASRVSTREIRLSLFVVSTSAEHCVNLFGSCTFFFTPSIFIDFFQTIHSNQKYGQWYYRYEHMLQPHRAIRDYKYDISGAIRKIKNTKVQKKKKRGKTKQKNPTRTVF